jgi:hypothetical protein
MAKAVLTDSGAIVGALSHRDRHKVKDLGTAGAQNSDSNDRWDVKPSVNTAKGGNRAQMDDFFC